MTLCWVDVVGCNVEENKNRGSTRVQEVAPLQDQSSKNPEKSLSL